VGFVFVGQAASFDIAVEAIEIEVDGNQASTSIPSLAVKEGDKLSVRAVITNYGPDKSSNIVVEFFYIEEFSDIASYIGKDTLPGMAKGRTLKAEIPWVATKTGKYTFVAKAAVVASTDKDDCACNNEIPRDKCDACSNSVEEKASPILFVVEDNAYFLKPLDLGSSEIAAGEELEHNLPWGGLMGPDDGQRADLVLYNLGRPFERDDFVEAWLKSVTASYRRIDREEEGFDLIPDKKIFLPNLAGDYVSVALKPAGRTWESGYLGLATNELSFAFLGREFVEDGDLKENINLAQGYPIEIRYVFNVALPGLQSPSSRITFPDTSAGKVLTVYPPINIWSYPSQEDSSTLRTEGTVEVLPTAGDAGIYHVITLQDAANPENQISKLVALTANDKPALFKLKWTYSFAEKVTSAVVAAVNNASEHLIFACTSAGKLYIVPDEEDDHGEVTEIPLSYGPKELTQPLVVTLEDRNVIIVGSEKGLHVVDPSSVKQGFVGTVEVEQKLPFNVPTTPINIQHRSVAGIWFVAETSSRTLLARLTLGNNVDDVEKIDPNITDVFVVKTVNTQLRTNAPWRSDKETFVFFGSTNGDIYAKYAGSGNDPDPDAKRDIKIQATGAFPVTGLRVAANGDDTDVLFAATEDGRIYGVEFREGQFAELRDPEEGRRVADVITDDLAIVRDHENEALALFVTSRVPNKEIIGLDADLESLKVEKMWEVEDIVFRFSTGHTLMVPVVDKETEPDDAKKDGRWKLLIGSANGILYALDLNLVEGVGPKDR